jgi:hypothetical protein
VPTLAERAGDFSADVTNNGAPITMRARKLGVTYFQIDSPYDIWLR